jgi:hypothetical protein
MLIFAVGFGWVRLLLEIARASRTQEPRKQTTFKATCLYFLLPA